MSTAPLNPFSSDPRYFGIGAAFPKPTRQHWNASAPTAVRSASVPVLVQSTEGQHVSNELHPPFSRMHYNLQAGRLEDSGLQGRWNSLRFGGYNLQQYDRTYRPDLEEHITAANKTALARTRSAAATEDVSLLKKVPLGEYQGKRMERNRNRVPETSFDRVIFHSTCLKTPQGQKVTGNFFPISLKDPPSMRVQPNPLVKTEAGIVGPEHLENAGRYVQRQIYHP
ncbi:unnamed protein product [Amoebophrya sp. A25]|nr:unnamed protein product [Amoebophrya sp. A25]|eukprot:GSA25T00011129001.1